MMTSCRLWTCLKVHLCNEGASTQSRQARERNVVQWATKCCRRGITFAGIEKEDSASHLTVGPPQPCLPATTSYRTRFGSLLATERVAIGCRQSHLQLQWRSPALSRPCGGGRAPTGMHLRISFRLQCLERPWRARLQ